MIVSNGPTADRQKKQLLLLCLMTDQGRIRPRPLRRRGYDGRFQARSEVRVDQERPEPASSSDVRYRGAAAVAGYRALRTDQSGGSLPRTVALSRRLNKQPSTDFIK